MKSIILCADDYGQNSAISQAIVELLKENHLSAVSCLTTSADWAAHAKWLIPYKNQVDIGLHFNLTTGKPLSQDLSSFFSLKDLMIKSNLHQLDRSAIAGELRAQLDKFIDTMGQLPDFLDGHQHVHQFPIIRDAIFDVYEEYLRPYNTYLRCTYDPRTLFRFKNVAYLKQLIIQLCGAIPFKQALTKRQIPHNLSFAGIYNFTYSIDYHRLFPRFLDQVQPGGLIMCHPGLLSSDESDEIFTSRHHEYLYFCSQQFSRDCTQHDVSFKRFGDLQK